jgi:hypothetical protein
MTREVQVLEATRTAHEQEMAERERALARQLWLQRLTQLGKLQDLLWERPTLDIPRSPTHRSESEDSWAVGRD